MYPEYPELRFDSYRSEVAELAEKAAEQDDASGAGAEFQAEAAALIMNRRQLLDEAFSDFEEHPEAVTESIKSVFPEYSFDGDDAQLSEQQSSAFEQLYTAEAETVGSDDAIAAGESTAPGAPEAIEYAKETLGQKTRVRDIIRLLRKDRGKLAGDGSRLLHDIVEHAVSNADKVLGQAKKLNDPQSLIENWKSVRVKAGVYQNLGTIMSAAGCYTDKQREEYLRRTEVLSSLCGVLTARMEILSSPVSRCADAEKIANASDEEQEKLRRQLRAAKLREQSGLLMCNMMTDLRAARKRYFISQLRLYFYKNGVRCGENFKFRDVSGSELSAVAAYRQLFVRRAPIYVIPAYYTGQVAVTPQLVQPIDHSGSIIVGSDIWTLINAPENANQEKTGALARGLDAVFHGLGLDLLRFRDEPSDEKLEARGTEPSFFESVRNTLHNLRELTEKTPDFTDDSADTFRARLYGTELNDEACDKLANFHQALLDMRSGSSDAGADRVDRVASVVVSSLLERQLSDVVDRLTGVDISGKLTDSMKELIKNEDPNAAIRGQVSDLASNEVFRGMVDAMSDREIETLCSTDMTKESASMFREFTANFSRAVMEKLHAAEASGSAAEAAPEPEQKPAEPSAETDAPQLVLEKKDSN